MITIHNIKKEEQEKRLLEVISKSMSLRDIITFEKEKLQIIIDFLEQNNINNLDNISMIGIGTYSRVFKINNFVIKIGLAKIRKDIIKSSNVAEEIIRLNIKFVTEKITMVVGIVIQKLAEKYENKCEEDLYNLFSSLREEKLIWTDVKYENVGKINEKLVVIDTDDIFYEKDFNIIWSTPLFQKFEERYKKERRM